MTERRNECDLPTRSQDGTTSIPFVVALSFYVDNFSGTLYVRSLDDHCYYM